MARDALVDGYALYLGDDDGTVGPDDDGGFFYRDTRHLSVFDVGVDSVDLATMGREFPAPDRRTVVASTVGSAVNSVGETGQIKQGSMSLRLYQTVTGDLHPRLEQRVELAAHASGYEGELAVSFDADFADVFEVRGFASGIDRSVVTDRSNEEVRYQYAYTDADGQERERRTTVAFDRVPDVLEDGRATFDVTLDPGETISLDVTVRPDVGPSRNGRRSEGPSERPNGGTGRAGAEHRPDNESTLSIPEVATGRESFDGLLARASQDLTALTARTDHGPVPLAGAPWFATVFGRDSLITAYQALPVAPSLARGTLRYLAANRGRTTDPVTEEAPGKIFHEERSGELARCQQVPHTPYYGTVDATPLWVVLLGELRRWTGDDGIVEELSTALDDALQWVNEARDRHGDDPFLYYDRSPNVGLRHKAWRDTPGSVQHPDGRNAEHPIASVEVQGYVYRALREAATLYEEALADPKRGDDLREAATRFADAFDAAFWVDEADYYAVARDGTGDAVPTPSSNVGHCLWADLVPENRLDDVVDGLFSPELFSGWGVRTLGCSADGYSPVSYHLGSVWPHDTSIVALGLAKYGRFEAVERLAQSLLEACIRFDGDQIPEVFCGFDDDVDPLTYPASCVPQAWSAGAPFATLRASFGLDPEHDPVVRNRPAFLDDSAVDGLLNQCDRLP